MVTKTVTLGSLTTLVLGCFGCHDANFSFQYVDDYPAQRHVYVDTPAVHICGRTCDQHYWNGARLVVLNNHHHGPRCGHHFDGSHWVVQIARALHAAPVHVCNRNCHGHFWNGHKLVSLHGHRHGPGCGHHFDNGRWGVSVSFGSGAIRLGAGHVCTHDCHDHFWNGSRIVKLTSHRHGRGCGHAFRGGHWIVAGKAHFKATSKHAHKGKLKAKKAKGKVKSKKAKDKHKSKRRVRP